MRPSSKINPFLVLRLLFLAFFVLCILMACLRFPLQILNYFGIAPSTFIWLSLVCLVHSIIHQEHKYSFTFSHKERRLAFLVLFLLCPWLALLIMTTLGI